MCIHVRTWLYEKCTEEVIRPVDRQTERQTNERADRQEAATKADRQAERQADRQPVRHTDLGDSLSSCHLALHLGEVVIVGGHVSDDDLLVRPVDVHI